MNIIYKKATLEDIDILVQTRIEVLLSANALPKYTDMTIIANQSRDYYEKALAEDSHTAYIVFDDITFVGTGGISYFRVMPTYNNPSGNKAYIMNMYTVPNYRRKGIALHTLDLLVKDAHGRNITFLSLEATEMGRPLYLKYGFVHMKSEMELPTTHFNTLDKYVVKHNS